VRYAKGCHPNDLMTSYHTSSKHVKKFIKEYGLPDIIKVTKKFQTSKQARNHETKFLKRSKAKYDFRSLNKTDNISISPEACSHAKGKTYEEIYGFDKAQELRNSRRESNKNRLQTPWSIESRNKASNRVSGQNNPKAKSYIINGLRFSLMKDAIAFIQNEYVVSFTIARNIILIRTESKILSERYSKAYDDFNIDIQSI
jgi:hypothetical protein